MTELELTDEMQKIKEEFELFQDWEERYGFLIDLGKGVDGLDNKFKTEEYIVEGCTSQVWLVATKDENNPEIYHFKADSDAFIVKGLVALLLRIYSGKKAEEIRKIEIEPFFETLGLEQHLSSNRSNGFFSMVKRIKALAL